MISKMEYFDDKLVLKIFEEKLGEGFNEKALFEDLDRVVTTTIRCRRRFGLCSSAEQLTCLNSDIIDEYLNFKNELIDKKRVFEPQGLRLKALRPLKKRFLCSLRRLQTKPEELTLQKRRSSFSVVRQSLTSLLYL